MKPLTEKSLNFGIHKEGNKLGWKSYCGSADNVVLYLLLLWLIWLRMLLLTGCFTLVLFSHASLCCCCGSGVHNFRCSVYYTVFKKLNGIVTFSISNTRNTVNTFSLHFLLFFYWRQSLQIRQGTVSWDFRPLFLMKYFWILNLVANFRTCNRNIAAK